VAETPVDRFAFTRDALKDLSRGFIVIRSARFLLASKIVRSNRSRVSRITSRSRRSSSRVADGERVEGSGWRIIAVIALARLAI